MKGCGPQWDLMFPTKGSNAFLKARGGGEWVLREAKVNLEKPKMSLRGGSKKL